LHYGSDWIPVAAVSFDLNRCPKGIGYNEMAPGTRPGASYKECGLLSIGCTQTVILVWLQSTTSVIHPRCCLHIRVNAPTILPLSLVCLARGNLDHLDLRSQLLKLHSPECLHQNISELILGVDVVSVDESLLNAVMNEVAPQLDMLASSWKTRF
jgi:hypothetical protein